jgi:hypothetical protein
MDVLHKPQAEHSQAKEAEEKKCFELRERYMLEDFLNHIAVLSSAKGKGTR